VSAWLRENKITPSQVFSNTKLKEDPVIETIIEKETAQEFKKRRIAEEALEEGKTTWEKEKKTLAEEAKTYKVKAMSGEISQKAKDLMTQRKLDEDQVAYLNDFIQDFTVDDPAQVESALNKRLDDGLKKYAFHAEKVFKVKKEAPPAAAAGAAAEPVKDDDIKQSAAYKDLSA
jgi:hypothetical protein